MLFIRIKIVTVSPLMMLFIALYFLNKSHSMHVHVKLIMLMFLFFLIAEQEHDLVALIPVRDNRLRPRRT